MPEGWLCYLRAPEKLVEADALQPKLKYTATLDENTTKSFGRTAISIIV